MGLCGFCIVGTAKQLERAERGRKAEAMMLSIVIKRH